MRFPRFLWLVLLLALAAPLSAAPVTAIAMSSQPNNFVGQGQNYFYDTTTGSISARRSGPNGVLISYSGTENWSFFFTPVGTNDLAPGTYENATRLGDVSAGLPGLDVSGNGRGFNGSIGRFTVKEVVFGTGNAITSFRAVFEIHEANSLPALFGEIWLNTEAPAPIPSQILTIPAGGAPVTLRIAAGAGATNFAASGLPSGLTLNPATGEITGSLAARGNYLFEATATASGLDVGGLVILVVQPSASAFSLQMISEPGEFVGQGLRYNYTTADGLFRASRNFDNGVSISFDGNTTDFWSLDFAAPQNAPLMLREYLGATRWPFQADNAPGLDVSGNGRGYNTSVGKFRILEIEYGILEQILRFAATFEQRGDFGQPAMRGTIRYNAGADVAPVPDLRTRTGQAFAYTITANNLPATFTATGLPPGLSIDSATGLISGIPLQSGFYQAEITVTGLTSVAVASIRFIVGPFAPQIVSSNAAQGAAGVPFSFAINVQNEPTSITSTGLPPGLHMDSNGLITGLPTRGGVFQVYVTASNELGGVSQVLTLSIARQDRLLFNVSTRARVQTDAGVLIGGFVIDGAVPKRVLLRAPGPSLTALLPAGAGALADPMLELRNSAGAVVASNDDWKSQEQALVTEIANSGYVPTNDKEAALVRTLDPGSYTVIVRGKNAGTGIALVEVYDLEPDSSRIINLSTRGRVETDAGVMIGGFVVSGNNPVRMVVRATGPSLARAGIPAASVLADPSMEIFNSNGDRMALSDDWRQDGGAADIAATPFAPLDDREPAVLVELPPGAYTAVVRGKNGTTGIGLVEVFRLPQ